MKPTPVIAIFDIGKTNKKFFLFNEQYKIVLESSVQFEETKDEDGFPCDDVERLTKWIKQTTEAILVNELYEVKAFNFSAYGASFVHIDESGNPLTPLYNYLKPYPQTVQKKFYETYGGETAFSVTTASPVLGSLNSGMQLYRLKQEHPQLFDKIQYSLHLPQYISYLLTGKACSEITGIGCHTGLWNFTTDVYHEWVCKEDIIQKLPPVFPSSEVIDVTLHGKTIHSGIGLHDSSAALIPYLAGFTEPFILLSTGTWCISLNPFNREPLTAEELQQDCLSYLTYNGTPVKASRLFAGNEHEQQVKLLAGHFKVPVDSYKKVIFLPSLLEKMDSANKKPLSETGLQASVFSQRNMNDFSFYEEAYHQLIYDIVQQQKKATSLVIGREKITRIFVDGGFAKNAVFMHMLAAVFPDREVYAASVSQATAIGAALAIHQCWNTQPVPGDMVELKYYAVTKGE